METLATKSCASRFYHVFVNYLKISAVVLTDARKTVFVECALYEKQNLYSFILESFDWM